MPFIKLKTFCTPLTGYGDVVPDTNYGKIFVIMYGLIGIPLNIAFIITIGALIAKASSEIIRHTEQRILRKTKAKHIHLKTCILLVTFFVSWMVIGASIHIYISKYNWLEAFYSVFLRVSTISSWEFQLTFKERNWYRELISWYTNIGLALATSTFYSIFQGIKMGENAGKRSAQPKRQQISEHENVGKTNNGAEFESEVLNIYELVETRK